MTGSLCDNTATTCHLISGRPPGLGGLQCRVSFGATWPMVPQGHKGSSGSSPRLFSVVKGLLNGPWRAVPHPPGTGVGWGGWSTLHSAPEGFLPGSLLVWGQMLWSLADAFHDLQFGIVATSLFAEDGVFPLFHSLCGFYVEFQRRGMQFSFKILDGAPGWLGRLSVRLRLRS